MNARRLDSVEGYLGSLDAAQARTLTSVIDLVLEEFSDLEAKISWNVPQIHRDGKYVFGVSAAKNHLALAPWSSRVIDEFRESLEGQGYVVRKNLFHVPNDWEVDRELVTGLVRARLAELDRN